jgi:arylsulfatase A-like enzyme
MIHTFGFVVFALLDVAKTHGGLLTLFYAVTLAAGCGLFLDGLILVSRRWWPLSYGAAVLIAARLSLSYTLERSAHFSFEGRFVRWIHFAFYLVFAGFPLVYAVARRLGRRHLGRVFLVAAAVALAVANHRLFNSGYFASHAFISWISAIFVGAIFPRRLPTKNVAAVAAVALFAFAVPPPNQVRIELFRSPTAIAPWVASTLRWSLPDEGAPKRRISEPPLRAPSSSPLVDNPLVILFVVDGLRWSLLEDPNFAWQFPAWQRLKKRGVHFTNVHSPGPSTVNAMATVFSGKYFSQLSWKMFGQGRLFGAFPVADSTPRVPALLTQAGVRTVKMGGIGFLQNQYAVAPGFAEEYLIPDDDRPAPGSDLMQRLQQLLPNQLAPTFLYVHFMDTHQPYRGPAGCAPFDCYRSQVAAVDAWLGQVLDALDQPPLAQRALVFFTADHGEAFGEHGTGGHSTTIYEELLRVPLIAYGAALSPRTVDDAISLADLGPTLLDLFGQPTPAGFLGESLEGALRGEKNTFTRPLFAEGRLRRAIIDDNLKVIVDLRRKTVEEYDLARDPGELENRFGDPRFAPLYSTLAEFFAAHAAPGGPWYRP